jgi:hypothetical protein
MSHYELVQHGWGQTADSTARLNVTRECQVGTPGSRQSYFDSDQVQVQQGEQQQQYVSPPDTLSS